MWQCPECSESVEPSLDICWNCGTSRDGSRDPGFRSADDLTRSDTANLLPVDSTLLASGVRAATPPPTKIKFLLRTFLGVAAVCAVVYSIVGWYTRPQTPEDFYRLAMVHLKSSEYSEGIADLTLAMELIEDEDNQSILPLFFAARATAFNNQGNYRSALHDASRAIDSLSARSGLSSLLAEDSSNNPVFIPPEIVSSLYLIRANALIGLGRRVEAVPDLNTVLREDPKSQSALHLLAIAEGRKDIDD